MPKSTTTSLLLYPLVKIPLVDEEQLKQEQILINNNAANINIVLPPTPTTSDDEVEIEQVKKIKLARRGTVSLGDLIPIASAALRERHRLSNLDLNNPPSTQDSPLARALTKVKIGVQTHRIKERFLTNEWIRLALNAPLDESNINIMNPTNVKYKTNRTREIVRWYEYKFKRLVLTLKELELKVDDLRQKRLLLVQQQTLPSPPPTRLKF